MSAAKTRLLVISPDSHIRQLVEAGLGGRGFAVTSVRDGGSAIGVLRTREVDLVLLDLALPDVRGLALLSAIRVARPRLPVIVLAAANDEDSTLASFKGGADDCLTKPFSLSELAARIGARLRSSARGGPVLEAGPVTLDLARHRASFRGHSALLSPRESSLLAVFLGRRGEVLSRDELLRLVWQIDFDPGSNVVEVYVSALRRKLGPSVVETVRGRGYRLHAVI